jgi:hypothetical protein
MGDSKSAASLVSRGRNDELLRRFTYVEGDRELHFVLRGGMTYVGAKLFLTSLGMAAGCATGVAIALTAIEVMYVE